MKLQHQVLIAALVFTWAVADPEEDAGSPDWSYTGSNNGAEKWCSLGKNSCCGDKQSPIDLQTSATEKRNVDAFEFVDYDATPKLVEIKNNGHAVQVKIVDENVKPRISGGGLEGEYVFECLHFHWGKGDAVQNSYENGSEHTYNGQHHPVELQIYHYKSKFESFVDAVMSTDSEAVAVFAIWIDFGEEGNKGVDVISSQMKNIRNSGEQVSLALKLTLNDLLPSTSGNGFYRYDGSISHPPCNEDVKWTVFADSISATPEMVNRFLQLSTYAGEPMVNNFRPVQNGNKRPVWHLSVK